MGIRNQAKSNLGGQIQFKSLENPVGLMTEAKSHVNRDPKMASCIPCINPIDIRINYYPGVTNKLDPPVLQRNLLEALIDANIIKSIDQVQELRYIVKDEPVHEPKATVMIKLFYDITTV